MPTTEQTYTLKDLQDIHQERRNAQTLADQLAARENDVLRALLRQGEHTQRELAVVVEVSRGRIAQIAVEATKSEREVAA